MKNRNSVDNLCDCICDLRHLTVDRTKFFQIFFCLRIVGDAVGKDLVRHYHQIFCPLQQMVDSIQDRLHSIVPGSAFLIDLICRQIRGVILNQISPMMYPRLKQIIEETLPVKVYGYVPVVKDCVLESRHLGLVMPEEIADLHDKLMKLAEILERSVDIDGLLELAEGAEELPVQEPLTGYHTKRTVRIALAKDEAFCFFYQDNLELLEEMGAQLIPFSPIHDEKLPENIDGMLFHGGYPELYAKALSENKKMLTSVREAVQAGIPYMAECGGFMYLHQEMEDMEGHSWPMAGVIPGKSWRTPRLTRFGYITLEDGTCFGKNVGGIRAHEFHYFDSDNCGESYTARKPLSSRSWNCIHSDRQGMSGFPHMYYYSNLQVPEQFLRTCEERKA